MKIERIEVRAVAPPVERFTWSDDLPDQYATNTVVRIFTDDGVEGVAGVWNATSFDYERYTAETIRHLAPILIGRDPLDRDAIWQDIRPRVFPLPPQALAALDIALWDLAGKVAGQPLYRMLAITRDRARDRIPAYASTPLFKDVPAYLDNVEKLLEKGFKAVKFHTWCIPELDLELARAVRKTYPGDEIAFMLDAEHNYDYAGALRVAQELEEMGFRWFEAPLHDSDLEGYRALTEAVNIPIIPSGNWFMELHSFRDAINTKAWGAARMDVAMMGGLTQARQAMDITVEAGINCEVMAWGFSLVSAANLHLMLAYDNCSFFEQAIPYEPYEYGMKDVIRTQPDGLVYAPEKPGLGLDVDWAAMEAATLHSIVVDSRG